MNWPRVLRCHSLGQDKIVCEDAFHRLVREISQYQMKIIHNGDGGTPGCDGLLLSDGVRYTGSSVIRKKTPALISCF